MQPVLQRLHGLQLRFMVVVVAAAVIFAAVAAAIAFEMGHLSAIQKGRATLDGLVSAVEKTAAIGCFADDRVLLQEVIDGIASHPLVGSVAVLDAKGDMLVLQRAASRAVNGAGVTIDRRLISPFNKIEQVGTLRIEANMPRLHADARAEATALALTMAAQTAMLALLLYAAGAYLVSRPIVRLARQLVDMTPGTDERLPTPDLHRHDEIGTLIAGANTLLAQTQAALHRERELRASVETMEAQYRQIFDATSAGIFVLDAEGRLINGNPTVLRVIGSPVQQVQQLRGQEFVRQVFARPEKAEAMIADAISRGETAAADLELIHRDGVARWVHCLISVQGRNTARQERDTIIEGVMYDVTDRKSNEMAVRHQAEHDPLTGLKNRAASDTAIDRFIADATAQGGSMTLLYVDLDGFKQVNDAMGHAAGDEVLEQCARRLQAAVRRTSDLVGRLGGDEFVIAMPSAGPEDEAIAAVAAEVLRALCEPMHLADGRRAQIGASIGMASFPLHGRTRKDLANAADDALYEVKRHGKNAYAMRLVARGDLRIDLPSQPATPSTPVQPPPRTRQTERA